jgi:hopanoid biosynthesis associated RND transporter like protein HpnN
LAKVDRLFQRRRMAIVFITSAIVLLGLSSLVWLRFDFNPLGLRSTQSEAVAVLKKLSNDQKIDPNAAEVLAPATDAEALTKRLSRLPEVQGTRDVDDLVPGDQEQKRRLIANTASVLGPALQTIGSPHSTDSEDVKALRSGAKELQDVSDETEGAGAQAAARLAENLKRLADSDPSFRRKAQATFVQPLLFDLRDLRQSLHPEAVTHSDLPGNLVRDWTAPDGRLRVEVMAKGNANDSATLVRFAQAVLSVQPNATGPAIEAYEWGNTILTAFAEAGLWAISAIAILLWLALRRIGDVLLTLIPLLVAAAATLEICALTGFALNYANIIALPALLGIGVAFKIYYVMEWRAGERNFLQSVLTRAVFFSAVMTATAFGSLCFSNQPGISSMGKLLALSLACTLASAALFQPALMGPPRGSR